ncbi:Guanine nucleotide-binding protein alpha-2 subunit [Elasticomyces elasticus]|nr:Guanine nucleotide-binding protein alpha-2 subunit [Elasticomyces elasticus]
MDYRGSSTAHNYHNVITSGNARVHNGDLYASGPVTVVTTSATVANVIDMLDQTADRIHTVRQFRRDADFTLLNVASQLTAFKAALGMIQEWADADAVEPYHQLRMDLDLCLTCCRMLVAKLDQVTEKMQSRTDPAVVELVVGSELLALEDLQKLKELLEGRDARRTLRVMKRDTASLIVNKDEESTARSRITDAGSKLSMIFTFDRELWMTDVYTKLSRQLAKKSIRQSQHTTTQLAGSRSKSPIQRSRAVDNTLAEDRLRLRQECMLLLLGNSADDRSTFMHHLKIVHGNWNGFSTAECVQYRPIILRYLVLCAKQLSRAMAELDLGVFDDPTLQGCTEAILECTLDSDLQIPIDPQIIDAVANLCSDLGVRYVLETLDLPRFAAYFLLEAGRLATAEYTPICADILRAPGGTSGAREERFLLGQLTIRITDPGLQEGAPDRWLHLLDSMTSIIFLVDLADYNQVTDEDPGENRMMMSLILFDRVVNTGWAQRSSVILILTNMASFKQKLDRVPLISHFPDYTGGNDANRATKYILWRFNELNRAHLRIHPHVMELTDSDNVRVIMATVKETILQNALWTPMTIHEAHART